jgi:hypothetical protein
MRRLSVKCLALLLVVAAHRDATAQRVVRGVVRDSEFAAPLPGAVVSVIDSSGASGARTITDAKGAFSLQASSRAASIHLIRIGYRPRDLPITSASLSLEVAMTRIPPILDAVRVVGQDLCPGSDDRGPAFQYWEQARAGLLAEVVAREANPATATMLVYERHERVGDETVRRQRTTARSGPTRQPFIAAAPPSTFARIGYMTESDGDRVYSAPDGTVLLDESFAATHCFHMQMPDAAHTGQIGLSFAPIPSHPDSIVDVAGTIWFDRTTPSLRSFDFQYTNLEPAAMRLPTGGHIEFRSVPNGVSFIERWWLRLPALGLAPGSSLIPPRTRRADRKTVVANEVQETGGQVIAASWLDGTEWRDSMTGLKGTITQRGNGRPVPNAIVSLLGTSDTVLTDDHGTFEFQPVVPGKYLVQVTDTALSMFASARTDSRAVEVARGKLADFRAALPPVSDAITRRCKESGDRMTTIIAGRVSLPGGASAAHGEVRATWQADYTGLTGPTVSIETAKRTINVDNDGRFAVCAVSIERPVRLRFEIGSVFADTTVKAPEGAYTIVDWRPQLSPVTPPKP